MSHNEWHIKTITNRLAVPISNRLSALEIHFRTDQNRTTRLPPTYARVMSPLKQYIRR